MALTVDVLVVEDDPLTAEVHAAYVGRVPGFAVRAVAASVREAIAALGAGGVDLVLLDLNLPDGHGLDLVRHLRAAGHTCDVIAVTAARDSAVVGRAVTQGVVGYLVKPFTFATFRARLEQYAAYRSRLADAPDGFGQDEVDDVLSALRPAPVTLPKGLGADTLREVLACVREADTARSAGEVALATGVSRVTARRYLEYLAESGALVRGVRHGGRGRPELEYGPA